MDEVTVCARKAAGGDHAALQRFIRLTQAEVWRFCANLGDREHADDLTQEVYLRALKGLPGFRGEASARTWLLAIARRAIADDLRSRQRRRAHQHALSIGTQGSDRAAGPTSAVDADPGGSVVLLAVVQQLPINRREAFVLTQLLGLSYAEAAAVCRCPVGTIRSRVARARADLVSAIDEADEPADAEQPAATAPAQRRATAAQPEPARPSTTARERRD